MDQPVIFAQQIVQLDLIKFSPFTGTLQGNWNALEPFKLIIWFDSQLVYFQSPANGKSGLKVYWFLSTTGFQSPFMLVIGFPEFFDTDDVRRTHGAAAH